MMQTKIRRREELEQRISELENSLSQLRQKLRAETEAEQHRSIDHLEDYFKEVDDRFSNLSDFWGVVVDELRSLFHSDAHSKGK